MAAPRQGGVYRTILKSSGVYGAGIIAQRIASVILLPVYTRYLTPRDYGTLELLDVSLSVFGILAGSCFTNALFYFYSKAAAGKERNVVISTALLAAAGFGIGGGLAGIASAPWLSRLVFQDVHHTLLFRILFVSYAWGLPLEMGFACLRAFDQPVRYSVASLARLLLAVAASVIFLVPLGMGVTGVLCGTAVSSFLAAAGLVFYCFKRCGLVFNGRLFAAQFLYAAPTALVGASLFVLHFGDRFFLQRFTSLAQVGIYSTAYKIGMAITYAVTAFNTYWNAKMYEYLAREDGEHIYARLFTYLMAVITFAALAVSLYARPALTVLTTPGYYEAARYVPWIALAYVVRTGGDFFRGLFYVDNRTAMDAGVNVLGALACLSAYAVLIPRWQLWGAIGATTIGFTTVGALSWYCVIRRRRNLALDWIRVAGILGAAFLVMAAVSYVPASHWPAQAALGTLGLLVYAALLFRIALSRAERARVMELTLRLAARLSRGAGLGDLP
jgi:O-antigen/teichoic acid export membrane protein